MELVIEKQVGSPDFYKVLDLKKQYNPNVL